MATMKARHFHYLWRPEKLTLNYLEEGDKAYSSLAVVTTGEVEWYDGNQDFLGTVPGPLMKEIPAEVFSELVTRVSEEKGAVVRAFHELPGWKHQVSTSISRELNALPVLFDGKYIGRDTGWTFPEFNGDGAFWVRGYNGENPRKVARLNGLVYCQWPGFGWQRGDY